MHRTLTSSLSATAVLVVLAACAGGDSAPARDADAGTPAGAAQSFAPTPSASPAATLSACALVTQAEVEQALGRAVRTRAEANGRTSSECGFSEAASADGAATLTLGWGPEGAPVFEGTRTMPNMGVRPAPGIGDDAYWTGLNDSYQMLYVRKGDHNLIVSTLGRHDRRAAGEQLARAALGRMP